MSIRTLLLLASATHVLGFSARVELNARLSSNLRAWAPEEQPTSKASAKHLRMQIKAAEAAGDCLLMPCCYDGLTARLVERAGFDLTFMTGFGVSATQGLPDVQLLGFGEMVAAARTITGSLRAIPCIGDGDTGYGSVMNIERTVQGYASAGLAGIMIEDQVSPKKCGHTKGKDVLPFDEAVERLRATVLARERLRSERGSDMVIIARTDAAGVLGMDEAIRRCKAFRELLDPTDITFLEAPTSVDEMRRYCAEVSGPKLANCLENGLTPMLSSSELASLGFTIAAYPLSLLAASIQAMEAALEGIKTGTLLNGDGLLKPFAETCDVVGFCEYYKREEELRGGS